MHGSYLSEKIDCKIMIDCPKYLNGNQPLHQHSPSV